MAIVIAQTATAVGPRIGASFGASGGTAPYSWQVIAGGAGGVIGSSSGLYTAPALPSTDPAKIYDRIRVTDNVGATQDARILVGYPIMLLMELIRVEMGLTEDQVRLWDQKLFQPEDGRLYVAVSNPTSRIIANINRPASSDTGFESQQFVSVLDRIECDVISRTLEAMNRKFDLPLALNSNYATEQQARNAFTLGYIPSHFLNISHLDGTAIPYRYKIGFNMQWAYEKTKPVEYFDDFSDPEVITQA